jgi:hypothetical protein
MFAASPQVIPLDRDKERRMRHINRRIRTKLDQGDSAYDVTVQLPSPE